MRKGLRNSRFYDTISLMNTNVHVIRTDYFGQPGTLAQEGML